MEKIAHELAGHLAGFFYAVIPPTVMAALGRMAFWAHHRRRMPTWAETIREFIIVCFMGIVGGGLGQWLGLPDGPVLWAWVSSMSFFGPRILAVGLDALMERFRVKTSNPCRIELFGDDSEG